MSLIMILPTICFTSIINKKLFIICSFINYISIISLQLSMKDICCMIILLLTSFIYLYLTYKKVLCSIIITVIINIIISLSDHITSFLFINAAKISFSKIESNKLLFFIFASIILLISCLISKLSNLILFNIKKILIKHDKY